MQYSGQEPVTIVLQNVEHVNKLNPSAAKQLKFFSWLQIAMGIINIVFGVVLIAISSNGYIYSVYIGYGIWIGVCFVVVGGFGIGTTKRNSTCMIVACMILNIICTALWCSTLLGLSSTGVAEASYKSCRYRTYGGCDTGTVIALNSCMLLMAIAQFVITIWSAALCCGAVCGCCKQRPSVPITHVHCSQDQVIQGQPLMMSQHSAYPISAVQQQQQGYIIQAAQPVGRTVQNTQPTGYIVPGGQSSGYVVQAAQPTPGYFVQPGQSVGYTVAAQSAAPPAYSSTDESTANQEHSPTSLPSKS